MFSTSFYPAAFQYSPSFGSGFHYPSPPPPPPHFEQFCASSHPPPHSFGGPFPPPPLVGPGFTYGLSVPPPHPFHTRPPPGVHRLPFPPPFFHGTFIPHHPSPHHPHPHHGPGPHRGPHFSHPSPPPPGFTMRDEAADMSGDHQEDDGAVRSGIPPPLTPSAHERHDESRSGLHGGSMSGHDDHGKPRERELDPTSPPPPPPSHGPNPPGDVPIPGDPPHPHGSRGRHCRHRRPLPRPIHGPTGPGGPPPPPDHPRFPPAPPLGLEFPGSCQHPGCYFTWPTWPPSSPHRGPFHHPPHLAFTACTCYDGPHQPAFNTSPFGQSCSCQFWDHRDQYSYDPPHPLSGHHHRGRRRGGAFRGRRQRGPAQRHRWEWRAPPELESESDSASDSSIEDREEDQTEMELPNEVPSGYETTDQSGRATGREDDWEGVEDDERISPTILARSVEEEKSIQD